MTKNSFRAWMLPDGVIEALPNEAQKLNYLERCAVDTFSAWGYELLRPPIMEYAETFISSNNRYDSDNLNRQTIQFKDQASGRQLGLRADITPQIARIDAHYLKTDKLARYSYTGEVVRSFPEGHGSFRNPTIAGVELLGSCSVQADIEMISLLITYLAHIGLNDYVIALGEVDIVTELLATLGVDEVAYTDFFDALGKKDVNRLQHLAERNGIDSDNSKPLTALLDLYGDISIFDEAKQVFADYDRVMLVLSALQQVVIQLQGRYPGTNFHVDLSDVPVYGYHNGLFFCVYTDGAWQAVARGGRYGNVSQYGAQGVQTPRPATGFSCNLNVLSTLLNEPATSGRRVLCRFSTLGYSCVLHRYVDKLRQQGDMVVCQFDDGIENIGEFTHFVHALKDSSETYTISAF